MIVDNIYTIKNKLINRNINFEVGEFNGFRFKTLNELNGEIIVEFDLIVSKNYEYENAMR
jgi:hypothetical protein